MSLSKLRELVIGKPGVLQSMGSQRVRHVRLYVILLATVSGMFGSSVSSSLPPSLHLSFLHYSAIFIHLLLTRKRAEFFRESDDYLKKSWKTLWMVLFLDSYGWSPPEVDSLTVSP